MSVLALMGLLPQGAAVEGRAVFEGQDLLRLPPSKLRRICGRELAMVFQDPMTSLHPMLSDRDAAHRPRAPASRPRTESRRRAGRRGPARGTDPGSGEHAPRVPAPVLRGMRQRIAIAVALACRPKLLVADEPTTALDVTVQAGIIRLLDRLRNESGLTIVLITHDLGVLSSIADRVAIFYAGRVVEAGTPDRRPRSSATSLYAWAPRCIAASGSCRDTARRDPGRAAHAASHSARLRVPSALPVRARFVRGRDPAARPCERARACVPGRSASHRSPR